MAKNHCDLYEQVCINRRIWQTNKSKKKKKRIKHAHEKKQQALQLFLSVAGAQPNSTIRDRTPYRQRLSEAEEWNGVSCKTIKCVKASEWHGINAFKQPLLQPLFPIPRMIGDAMKR